MSAIKKFFEKKKTDAKFKLLGSGQKLGDAKAAGEASASRAAAVMAASGSKQAAPRGPLSQQQKLAAQAALTRCQQTSQADDFGKRRSQAAIRAQAKKELEKEKQDQEEVGKLKTVYGDKPEKEVEGPLMLAASRVLYKCPIIGNQVLPKDEMRKLIKEFLYSQVDEEPGLTSCLLIHTLTKDPDKVQVCVDTLCKYLDNITNNPTEEKYRRIRKSNKAYVDRVAIVEGADLFLQSVGFESEMAEDGQEFWVYPDNLLDETSIQGVLMLRDALVSAEPIRAELDRGLRVLLPAEAGKKINLPPDFFAVSAEEVKREQQARSDAVERESMLRTKAMREKEEIRERKKYRFCLIRIRFPDGLVLQGTFSVYEKFKLVYDFVGDNLEHPLPFLLCDTCPGGQQRLEAEAARDASLMDLGLVPTAVLNFAWHPDMAQEIKSQLGPNAKFLKDEIAALATTAD